MAIVQVMEPAELLALGHPAQVRRVLRTQRQDLRLAPLLELPRALQLVPPTQDPLAQARRQVRPEVRIPAAATLVLEVTPVQQEAPQAVRVIPPIAQQVPTQRTLRRLQRRKEIQDPLARALWAQVHQQVVHLVPALVPVEQARAEQVPTVQAPEVQAPVINFHYLSLKESSSPVPELS
jgi:hypothetical protein